MDDDIWKHFEPTGFDKYFSDVSTTIRTLLLDQNIITELKNQNPLLLKHLDDHKRQFITQMIQNTVVMPSQSQGYDRCHRLPYISSQLLALDSDLIYKQFFRQDQKVVQNEYWNSLLVFLDGKAAQNEVLMGYFQKVMSNLYLGNKAKTATIVANHLDRFIKFLTNGSVGDILKKALVLYSEPDGIVIQDRKTILHSIMNVLVKGKQQVRAVCADIIGEVVNKFQAFSSGQALVQELLNSQTFSQLFTVENSEAVNNFLIHLIKKTQQKVINQNDQSVPILKYPQNHKKALQKYLKNEIQNIRNISKSPGFIINQNKQTVRKSNKSIYPILTLVGLVLKDNYCSFINQSFVSYLWNLVVLYPYNNILHGIVRNIFVGILHCHHQDVRRCFLNNYQASVVSLGKQHLTLLRPFIYDIWRQAKKYPQVTTDPLVLSEFQEFVEKNLEPLTQYDIKKVQKSSASPPQKLIVDEGDLAKAAPEESVQNDKISEQQQNVEEKEESKGPHEQVRQNIQQNAQQPQRQQQEVQEKVDKLEEQKKNPESLKESQDFFSNNQESTSKTFQKPSDSLFEDFLGFTPSKQPEQAVKKENGNFDLFNNFSASPPKKDLNIVQSQQRPQEGQQLNKQVKKDFFDDFANF